MTNDPDIVKLTEAPAMLCNSKQYFTTKLQVLQSCRLPFCATFSASWYMPSMK